MRTLEEVDADIAETKRQIELGNAFNRRAARFDYILEGDRSGLDAIGQAINNAIERERQQKFQNSQVLAQQNFSSGQADLQRKFQAEEAEKQRQFQMGENKLMRESQEKVRQDDLYLERARALRDIADARAVYDDTKKKYGPKTLDFARAGNMLRLQIANGRKLGIDTDKLNELDPDYVAQKETPKETPKEAPNGGSKAKPTGGSLGADQSAESTANDVIGKIKAAKTVGEVEELFSGLPFGNDATNTELYQKVKTAHDNRINEIRNKANADEKERLHGEYLNKLLAEPAKLVTDLHKRKRAGQSTFPVPKEYGGGEASFTPNGLRGYTIKLGKQTVEVNDNR
jgi:hypothetical protein